MTTRPPSSASASFRGREDRYPYKLFLQLEGIEHRMIQVGRPPSKGFAKIDLESATVETTNDSEAGESAFNKVLSSVKERNPEAVVSGASAMKPRS